MGLSPLADGGNPFVDDIPDGPCTFQGGWEDCDSISEDPWLEVFLGPFGGVKTGTASIGRRVASWLGGRKSVWKLAPVARGLAIERALGGNLPRSFPVIDRFDRGVATSIKSIDLTAKTYQNSGALSRRLGGYVDKVAAFRGKDFGGVGIEASDITGRVLVVAVPAGAATAGQERALKALVGYGVSRGVHVRIVSVR